MYQLLIKLLSALAGEILTQYILPLLDTKRKDLLAKLAPIAERWVKAVEENTDRSGVEKKDQASVQIWAELAGMGLSYPAVRQADIDNAIQLAFTKLGLDRD